MEKLTLSQVLSSIFTEEAELLNGRLAMIGWFIYFLADGLTRLL